MSPEYESERNRQAERLFIALIERTWPHVAIEKTPKSARTIAPDGKSSNDVDYIIWGEEDAFALGEFKERKHEVCAGDGIFLEAAKIETAAQWCRAGHAPGFPEIEMPEVPFYFFVQADDGDFFAKIDLSVPYATRWLTDPRDGITDRVAIIPSADFVRVTLRSCPF